MMLDPQGRLQVLVPSQPVQTQGMCSMLAGKSWEWGGWYQTLLRVFIFFSLCLFP